MEIASANGFDAAALENCSREPIHIPSAIQPHGTLIAFREPELEMVQVAENLGDHVGLSATDALGKNLDAIFDPDAIEAIRSALNGDPAKANPLRVSIARDGRRLSFDAILHRSLGATVLELEPEAADRPVEFLGFYRSVRDSIGLIQSATTVEAACQAAVEEIAKISGFGRVMAYRFDADWHGTTIAESVIPSMTSYQGLRFPASDIPAQARRLYAVNWMRLIANSDYRPAKLVPSLNPTTGKPLDMSYCVLRSVSPVHLEYLRNMGDCAASMSVSVMKGTELWALIACHHPEPRHVPYQERAACEFIGRMLSHHVTTLEIEDKRTRVESAREKIARVMSGLDRQVSLIEGLTARGRDLMDIGGATGVAILMRGHLKLIGVTPDEAQVRSLLPQLSPSTTDALFLTDNLEARFPAASAYQSLASGVMAFTTTDARQTMVVWFRPELVRTVSWAGNPQKPVEEPTPGDMRIHPRRSFAVWQETLRGRSAPWESVVAECALELRHLLVTEELVRTNAELALSNQELDNYGYIVSHDLKEPVRGIRNYISFLTQDHGRDIMPGVKTRLDQIVSLTRRMDELLDSLFHYSRVGRVALAKETVDLNDVLRRVTESLNFTIESEKVRVEVPRPLPRLACDRARVGEIFFNLILNGIKYNNSIEKKIEIGFRDTAPTVFYIKDNGIGIADNHREMVFRMFKRLHARDKYGGGTGSGLAIVRRIIEMHGGRVWIDSKPGEGANFQFTLERDDAARND